MHPWRQTAWSWTNVLLRRHLQNDVLLTPLNQLHGVADAVRAGCAGGGDGVVHAFDGKGVARLADTLLAIVRVTR